MSGEVGDARKRLAEQALAEEAGRGVAVGGVGERVAAVLAEHYPPNEILTSLADAWATCSCGERFALTVTDDVISPSEVAAWWRAHVAAALASLIAAEVAAAGAGALREASDDVPLFEFMLVMDIGSEVAPAQIAGWLRDRADRLAPNGGA